MKNNLNSTQLDSNPEASDIIHSKRRAIEDILEDRYLSYEIDPYDELLSKKPQS